MKTEIKKSNVVQKHKLKNYYNIIHCILLFISHNEIHASSSEYSIIYM